MIDYDKQTTKETRKTHIDNLFRVVQYCENKIDCRRSQQLHYFGETHFNPAACKEDTTTTCDNCNVNSKVNKTTPNIGQNISRKKSALSSFERNNEIKFPQMGRPQK